MDFNEYQIAASRTANTELNYEMELLNYTLGLGGEAGEVQELIKKRAFHKHEIDREEVAKELGDTLWYLSQLARMIGYNLQDIADQNIEKLKKRYPEKFTTEDSIRRVDTKEVVLVLAGNYFQFRQFVAGRDDLSRVEYRYIHDELQLRGYRNAAYVLVGTYYNNEAYRSDRFQEYCRLGYFQKWNGWKA